ncbi:MAG TPA: 5-oxoprolinase subunit PxpB [bacterium]|nr:5-oxoprolinase subunit PxpB [bacterium]
MDVTTPQFRPLGDAGLVVEFGGDEISDAANAAVLALRRELDARPPAGVRETVPTYRSLLVVYDPASTSASEVRTAVTERLREADLMHLPAGRLIEIPTAYGGVHGPDLAGVAAETGLSEAQVVAVHTGAEYRVYMLGFSPGFPYMGTLPPPIRVPRLPSPRTRVPVRSVAMAGQQTGVYPTDSPGGWRLIGRTPLRIYDPLRSEPFLLDAGDRVRYAAISAEEYEQRAPVDESTLPAVIPSRPDFVAEHGGLLTTIQDLGRPGYRRFGMPQSGAMDPLALRIVNLLLGNPPGAAAVEVTFPGPRLIALHRTTIAIGGADLAPLVNGRDAPMWCAVALAEGDVLSFGAPRTGLWGYVAMPGGVDVSPVLGSRATYVRGGIGGYGGRRLRGGDRLAASRRAPAASLRLAGPHAPRIGGDAEVRVVMGPQEDYFTPEAVAAFLAEEYHLSYEVDRVGYRLDGPRLSHRARVELLSDGLLPGAIQVPAGGQPIVIMADGPTAGGYPKIAAVVRRDLRLLAQLPRGTPLRFRAVDWETSRRASQDEAAYLASLRFERA